MDIQENNLEDTEIEETETTTEETETVTPKRRGRKPGVKLEVRPAFWIGAAVLEGRLLHERLQAPPSSSDEEKKNFSEEAARESFKSKYNVEPEILYGPCRDYKIQKIITSSPKKDMIPMSEDVSFGKRIHASVEFKGWIGQVYEAKISNPEDFSQKYHIPVEDCGIFWPIKEAKPSPDGKKRNVPASSIILLSSLKVENKELQNN